MTHTSELIELTTAEQDAICGGGAGVNLGSFNFSKGFGNITVQSNNIVQVPVAVSLGGGPTEANAWAVPININNIF